ncbi:MAG: S1-like domain-containing RNA-binding protein [Clostridium sp.]
MIELGRRQELEIIREKDFGVYLGEKGLAEESVLLPKKQVPEGMKIGDKVDVFIYKDSEDRLIATTGSPKLEVGEVALLTVKDVGKIGAFLDMGLEKDLLLPFKEQNHPVSMGEECLVALYVDKSSRLAATMNVYPYLSSESPYKKEDWVEGRIYEENDNLGIFMAVDDKYFGLIPKREMYRTCKMGEIIKARVTKVREDGKLDLTPREKSYLQMNSDADIVMEVIEKFDGVLPFTDKTDPDTLKKEFNLSKNAFKRAVGHLLKERKIEITETSIRKIEE